MLAFKKHKSLVNIYFYSMVGLTLLLTILFGYIWIYKETARFDADSKEMVSTYIQGHKDKIKSEVEHIVDYINYKKSQAKERLQNEVKQRTYEAYQTMSHIYEQNKNIKTTKEIKKLINDALYSISWDDGRGYYFVEDTDGVELINRNNPDLIGVNIIDIRDSKGNYLMKDIIAAATSPEGEGYCSYYWNKPDKPNIHVPKISFVKHFEPFDWIIGNGKYLDEEESLIQQEVIDYIDTIRFETDRYYFSGNLDGLSYTGPARGRNMYDLEDVNGVKIVQELIKSAKNGGGFVEYVMPKLKDQKPLPKISYAMLVPEWEWYVGSGTYIYEIEDIIKEKQLALQKHIKSLIFQYAAAVIFMLVVIFTLVKVITNRIKSNLESFSEFFSKASIADIKIKQDDIAFSEFSKVASYANKMINRRLDDQAAVSKNQKKYEAIFESSRDAIFLIDPHAGILDCNPAALTMFGINDKKMILKYQPAALSPKYQSDGSLSADHLRKIIYNTIEHGGELYEWTHKRLNGEEFPSSTQTTKITINGKPVVFSTIRDISEQKKTQALIIQTEKMLSMGGLAAGMAHEINNPLAGVMQTAAVLENRLLNITAFNSNIEAAKNADIDFDKLDEYLKSRGVDRMLTSIKESGNRIAQIVRNMLNFARVNTEKKLQSIPHLIDQAIEIASIDYHQKSNYDFKNVDIKREYSKDLPQVLCDAGMIQQVILNLLKNGAHAMQNGDGKPPVFDVRVWFDDVQGMVCIEIEDNGPGVSPAITHRVFEPFYTTKAPGSGTGLGLSVSYYIITENHAGKMVLDQKPGSGAKFIIMLPIQD